MNKKVLGVLLLLLTALIWGTAFIAQKTSMDYIDPFTFGGTRTFIGVIALLPLMIILDKNRRKKEMSVAGLSDERIKEIKDAPFFSKNELIAGLFCGIAFFFATNVQQYGVSFTTVSKSGFITVLYIAFVPIFSVLIRKKVRPIMWLCVLLGVIGFFLLTAEGNLDLSNIGGYLSNWIATLGLGDLLVLGCAALFGIHIMVVDNFVDAGDGLKISWIQFLVSATLSMVCAFIFDDINISAIIDAIIPILYAGVLSTGVGYTLQVICQKWVEPTVASLLMSLESVFAVLGAWVILDERLTLVQIIGCIVIFIAVIISNLPDKSEASLQG